MMGWVAMRSPWMPRAGMFLGNCGRGSMLTAEVTSGSARSATRWLLLTTSVSSSMQEAALSRTRKEPFLWRGTLHSAIFCSTTCLELVSPVLLFRWCRVSVGNRSPATLFYMLPGVYGEPAPATICGTMLNLPFVLLFLELCECCTECCGTMLPAWSCS